MSQGAQSWRFPRMFWTGNAAELCERAAYYGTFIALSLYLTRVLVGSPGYSAAGSISFPSLPGP